MADTAELEAMGQAGAARVAERHNITIEVKKLADIIAAPVTIAGQRNPYSLPAPAMAGH